MKKRLLSLVLCLVMVFSLLPLGSFAQVYPVDGNVTALEINFMNGTTLISTQNVYKETGTALPNGAIYDPGCPLEPGTMFIGWQIGSGDATDINGVLDYVNTNNPTGTLTVNAVTSPVRYLVYMDENNRVLKTDTVANSAQSGWNITVDYDYVPAEASEDHVGWALSQDSDTVDYYNGDTITVNEYRVMLYPVCKTGAWLSFDANIGQDNDPTKSTFTAPLFFIEGQTTQEPEAPTRPGYTFGGWYADATLNTPYTFGQTLSADKELYAKWNAASTTYQVIFWKQKITDAPDTPNADKTYDYFAAISETRNATTGQQVSITQTDRGMARAATPNIVQGTTEKWNFFQYNAENTDTGSVTVRGDGSTVLNVYYDRALITLNFWNGTGTSQLYQDEYINLSDGAGYYTYEDPYASGYYLIGGANGPYGANWRPSNGTTVYSFEAMRKGRYTNSSYEGTYSEYYSPGTTLNYTTTYSANNSDFTEYNGTLYHQHWYYVVTNPYFAQFYYYESQSGTYAVGTGPDPTAGAVETDIPGATHYAVYPSGYYLIGDPNGALGNYQPVAGQTVYVRQDPNWSNWGSPGNYQHFYTNGTYREYTYDPTDYSSQPGNLYNYGPVDPYTNSGFPLYSDYHYNFRWNSSGHLIAYLRWTNSISDSHKYRPVYYKYDNPYSTSSTIQYHERGELPTPDAPLTYVHKQTTYTGLYGAAFTEWPSLSSGNVWYTGTYSTYNDRSTKYPLPLRVFDNADYGEASANQSDTMNFHHREYTANNTMHYYGQTLAGGDNYEEWFSFKVGNGSWSPTEKIPGFTVSKYSYNNRTWDDTSETESFSSSESNIYVRFTRNQHDFVMSSNNAVVLNETLFYETPLNGYGASDYIPTNGPDGAYFDGWYADPGFTTPFDFNITMPDNDVIVYAKWTMMRFRVLLDPTGGDPTIVSQIHFPANQATAFRVDYGEKIEKNAIAAATRDPSGSKTYQLVGWYSDPEFQHPFNFDFSEWTQIADFSYASAPDSERQGTDAWNGNRPWDDSDEANKDVVGKIVLYAKWRQLMNPDDFIMVKYDANGGENPPSDDTSYYADMSQAIAQPASTKAGEHFRAWLILDKNGNPTGEEVRPGGTFNVEYDNAVPNAENEHEFDVWLKADYSAPAGAVEIPWFANYEGASAEIVYAQPFAATDVHAAPTNPDGEFLGWARENRPDGDNYTPRDNLNVWLAWDGTQYKVGDKVVTQIYSDLDVNINQALYAVWEKYETNDVRLMDYGVTGTVATGVKADSLKTKYSGFNLSSDGTLTFKYIANDTSFAENADGSIVGWNYNYSGIASAKTATYRDTNNKLHKVTVVAASSAYFDDDLDSAAKTELDGSGVLDSAVATTAKDTDGEKVTRITINFVGTGIDVYCTSASDSGRVSYKLDGTGGVMVNKNGAESATYYNAPTIRKLGLTYGPHELVITCGAAAKYKLDGIRIYGATQDTKQAKELQAVYQNLRTILQTTTPVETDIVAGAVFVPGGEANDTSYTDGTINEIMLSSGQGVAFQVEGMGTADKMYIGLASAAGGAAQVTVSFGENAVERYDFSNTVHTFYEVKTTSGGYVYIKNTGANLVSVTDLKIVPAATRMFSFRASAPLMRYVESFDALPLASEVVETPPEPSAEPEPTPSADPEPTPSADPEPTQQPTFQDIISDLLSSFVNALFGSISRLFGRP